MLRTTFEMLRRLAGGLASRWRNLYYRLLGVRFGGYVWLRQVEIPRNFSDIELGRRCALDRGVALVCSGASGKMPKISIGAGTYINRYTIIDASESVIVGKECAIGPHCYLTDHDHGMDVECAPLKQPLIARPTQIGDRVWLGAGVIVLKGVTVGERSIVGAGSVVTTDLPAGVVAVGVPARVVRARVSGGTVDDELSASIVLSTKS